MRLSLKLFLYSITGTGNPEKKYGIHNASPTGRFAAAFD
jgi:hypothetical protein